jgi:hypothetical protein
MFNVKHSVLIFLLTISSIWVNAQEMPIILKAMNDEMQRGMKELRMDGHEAPFYISYDINDIKTHYFSASAGALLQSGTRGARSKNTRILVGDYEFNDESLDNDIYTNPKPNEIPMPLDDDYLGIRRSLWITTDAIYRSAAQHFKENQNTLKEKGKELKDLPHRTFARVKPQKVNQYKNFPELDAARYEDLVRKLSNQLGDMKELYTSSISLNILQGNRYYVNSEGTQAITPISNIVLQIRVSKDHRTSNNREKVMYFSSVDKIPSAEVLIEKVKSFGNLVLAEKNEFKIQEEYSGPVLFTDDAVGAILTVLLFGRETLMANNDLDVDNKQRYESMNTLEERIGKTIVSESMTVKAKPKLKTFQDVELMGSFEIDDEGVTPPDELVLVDKGVLKTLLNDRSLTKPDQTSNGHASGPGVIEVSFDGNENDKSLKQMLIKLADEEGYDYAYIVKKISFRGMSDSEVYQVDAKTGEEKRISDSRLAGLQLRSLRKSFGSKQLMAINFPMSGNNMVSFICPEALLIEDVDVIPSRMKEPEDEAAFFVEPPKGQ